jgi:hypothetical protein
MHGSAASSKPLSCLQLQHQAEGWEKYEGAAARIYMNDVCLNYIYSCLNVKSHLITNRLNRCSTQ